LLPGQPELGHGHRKWNYVENFIFSKQNQVDEICLETCQKILEKDYGKCLERFSMWVYSAI